MVETAQYQPMNDKSSLNLADCFAFQKIRDVDRR